MARGMASHLSDGTADPGLLDQIAALEWAWENIAAVGGDVANVTRLRGVGRGDERRHAALAAAHRGSFPARHRPKRGSSSGDLGGAATARRIGHYRGA